MHLLALNIRETRFNNQGQVLHTGPNKHADKNIQITVFKNRLKYLSQSLKVFRYVLEFINVSNSGFTWNTVKLNLFGGFIRWHCDKMLEAVRVLASLRKWISRWVFCLPAHLVKQNKSIFVCKASQERRSRRGSPKMLSSFKRLANIENEERRRRREPTTTTVSVPRENPKILWCFSFGLQMQSGRK